MRSSVVLPAPLGPSTTQCSPGPISHADVVEDARAVDLETHVRAAKRGNHEPVLLGSQLGGQLAPLVFGATIGFIGGAG